jgi:hypothetical protein
VRLASACFALAVLAALGAFWVSREEDSPSPGSTPRPSEVVIPADARYVSAGTGSDSNPGTQSAPWRTLSKAISGAGPGDVVVLGPGTYGGLGQTTSFSRSGTAAAPIVFTSQPGQSRAVVRGYVRVSGSHLQLDSLLFDGPTGQIVSPSSSNPGGEEVQISIRNASDVELSNSEVRDNDYHAGVFISLSSDVRVIGNYVHDNGNAALGANLDHGVYWFSGTGVIAENRIEGNVAYGVQLYPEAEHVQVTHNTISGNGRGGVIVSGESAHNEISNNLVADNGEYGIRAYSLTGAGNVARDNLIWNSGLPTPGSGISFSGTVEVDPEQLSPSDAAAYGAP